MTYLFLILFLAAMVGVFRPFKFLPDSKRWQYGLAAFVCFMAVGITAPEPKATANIPESGAKKAEKPAVAISQSPQEETEDQAHPSKWMYDTSEDKMRGGERRFATLQSENTIHFDFPYGEQPGMITVRQDPQYGLDVMFSLPSGQILCHGFGDSYINAKFDDDAIRRFNCTGSSDGSSEVAFVTNPRSFLSALKSADKTVIEAEFYQSGRQQYVFDTRNLKWE